MATAGGDTLGYWLTGNDSRASTPASMVAIASTQAKMGRLIKNLDIVFSPLCLVKVRRLCQRSFHHFDLRSRADLLAALDDHTIARIQALCDHPLVLHHAFVHDRSGFYAVLRVYNVNGGVVVSEHEGLVRKQVNAIALPAFHQSMDKHAG